VAIKLNKLFVGYVLSVKAHTANFLDSGITTKPTPFQSNYHKILHRINTFLTKRIIQINIIRPIGTIF
jgi:hypothetical protein